jgi:tetratricopeptide (TPR) repeat protein
MMKRSFVLAILAAITDMRVPGQFLPDLQAKTPEEYDAYLDVLDGPLPDKGVLFERTYPQSALLLPVYELMAREWRSRGNAERATEYARKALTISPDYVPMVTELADLLANRGSNLDEALSAGRRALVILENVKASRRVREADWTTAVAKLRARAHGAVGLALFRKDDIPGAIAEFEMALAEPATSEPLLHYRLGRLYVVSGRKAEGRKHLKEAADRGDEMLREWARHALAAID